MLTVKNVHKRIEDNQVLEDITFTMNKGKIVGLVGRNGVGKTTLLRSLVGIIDPDAGEITFEGKDIFKHPEVKQSLFYVPDSTTVYNGYSIKELVRLYSLIYSDFEEGIFNELMKRFQLPLDRKVKSFSRGMKALLLIILAISSRAKYIILDEPTNGLDVIAKRQILQLLIEEVSGREVSLLVSSHQLDELEKIADIIMIMKQGKIDSIITMEETKQHTKKIQVVFKEGFPPSLETLPNVKVLNKMGRVTTLLINGKTDETVAIFEKEHPLLLEELPMTLEDMFVFVLGGDENVK